MAPVQRYSPSRLRVPQLRNAPYTLPPTPPAAVPEPPAGPLFGATADPSDTLAMVTAWSNVQYMREYGTGAGPSLTTDGTGKYASNIRALFPGVYHQGWKASVSELSSYDITTGRSRYYTWYHEPADNMSGASYVSQVSPITGIINGHPDNNLMLGHGPCLTRWQIANQPPPLVDPADFWYTGATIFFADSYNPSSTFYWSPEDMFGPIRDAAAELGVPWGVPEWGGERLASDSTGSGRAAWITDCIQFLQGQSQCRVVGWWDRGNTKVSDQPGWPEFAALAAVLD